MELRAAYKQTDVGVIPVDWEVQLLGGVASITTGRKDVNEGDPSGEYPFFTCSRTHTFSRSFSFDTEAILIAGNGDVGNLSYYSGCFEAYQRTYVLHKFEIPVGYLWQQLVFRLTASLGLGKIGSSIPYIKKENLTGFAFPRPSFSEQQAIAEVLGDVDALLAGMDRLIAKKRDIKQAAMQQLLTGQTRLPGFQGEWEVKRLGDLGTFLKGVGVKKDESRSGDIPCVRYGEIYTHHNDFIRSFNSWISHDVASTATRLRSGDLLFAGSGETKAEIGKCVAFIQDCEAYAGGDIVILRPVGVDSSFMGYYCNTSPITAQKASKGQGDAVVHISAAALGSIFVALPAPAEQAAIAAVLSDMDSELTTLEARREKTRALKRAMMQELLTGRTRLVMLDDEEDAVC